MPAELPAPILLLLHEGGWDEVLMVAVGLGVAYLVIMWTGRRSNEDDEEDDDVDDGDEDGGDADSMTDAGSAVRDKPQHPKP
jgi:hypothetical protein